MLAWPLALQNPTAIGRNSHFSSKATTFLIRQTSSTTLCLGKTALIKRQQRQHRPGCSVGINDPVRLKTAGILALARWCSVIWRRWHLGCCSPSTTEAHQRSRRSFLSFIWASCSQFRPHLGYIGRLFVPWLALRWRSIQMRPCGSDVSSQDGVNRQIFLKMAFGCRLKRFFFKKNKRKQTREKVANVCKETSSAGNTGLRVPETKDRKGGVWKGIKLMNANI